MTQNSRVFFRENLHQYLQDIMTQPREPVTRNISPTDTKISPDVEDGLQECINEMIEAHERYKFLLNHVNDITFKNEVIQYEDKHIVHEIVQDIIKNNTKSPFYEELSEKSKLKHHLREIFESEEKYRFLIENIGEIIFTCDSDYRITYLNPQWERMLGFPMIAALGTDLLDFIHDNDLAILKEKLHRLFTKSVKIVNLEYKIRNADGEWKSHLMTCTPIHDFQGKVIELIGVSRDISEHKQLQEKISRYNEQLKDKVQKRTTEVNVALKEINDVNTKLIHSEKMAAIGELSSGIAHEFNNLVGIMQAYAEFVRKLPTDNNVKKLIDVILTSSKRARTITQSLLSFARRITPSKELADIHATIDEVLLLMENDLRKSNIAIIKQYDPDIPEFIFDSGQIGQVFLNLFVNAKDALSHKRTGGQIIVSTRNLGDCVRVKVTDNGIGIKESYLDKIFNPFVSTKGAYGKSKTPGTGLGLSVSLGIIENHQGAIEVESAENIGTTFSITLPKKQKATITGKTGVQIGCHSSGSSHGTIIANKEHVFPQRPYPQAATLLVADDDDYFRNALSNLLCSEGYNVIPAEDGETAINLYKNSQVDLVLLDLTMPGINGVDTISILQNISPDVKIIALIANNDTSSIVELSHYTIYSVVTKPFDIERLIQIINDALDEEKR